MRAQSTLLASLLLGGCVLAGQTAWAQGAWEFELPDDSAPIDEDDPESGSAADIPSSDPEDELPPELPDDDGYRGVYERAAERITAEPDAPPPSDAVGPRGRRHGPSGSGVQWGVVPDEGSGPAVKTDPKPDPQAGAGEVRGDPGDPGAPEDGAEVIAEGEAGSDGGVGSGGEGSPSEAEVSRGAVELLLPEIAPDEIAALWRARAIDLREMDPSLARSREEAIVQIAQTLQLQNLPRVSAVLIREGRDDIEQGRSAQALRKAKLALTLSPLLPEAERFLARATLLDDPGSVGAILGAGFRSLTGAFGLLPERRMMAANLLAMLGLAALVALVLFLGITLLRQLRLFLHDFHHRFPRGTTPLQSTVVAGVLFSLPLFLGLGLLPALILPAIATCPYVGRIRRGAILLAVAGVGLAVPASTKLGEMASFWESRAADVWLLEHTGEWEEALPRLRARAEAGSAAYAELFALARAEKRLGHLEKARRLYERAAAKGGADDPALQNNLGVILFALGDLDGSKAALQKAVALDHGLAAGFHNLAKVYFKRSELAKGQEARRLALDLDRAVVEAHPDSEPRLNIAFADLPLAEARLTSLLGDALDERPALQARAKLAGVFPEIGSATLAGVGVVLILLGGFLRQRLGVAGPCSRCGRPVCRRCDRESRAETCGQCVNVFERRDGVAPELRQAKERAIRRRQNLLDRSEQIAGILLPGTGQIFAHRPLLGLLLLFVFLFGATSILFWNGPLPSALWADGALPLWRIVGSGVLMLLAWAVSVWSVVRR